MFSRLCAYSAPRSRYAMSGTDAAYCATRKPTTPRSWFRSPIQTTCKSGLMPRYQLPQSNTCARNPLHQRGTDSSVFLSGRESRIGRRWVIYRPDCTAHRNCPERPQAGPVSARIRRKHRCQSHGRVLQTQGATRLRVCYEMSSTDVEYIALRVLHYQRCVTVVENPTRYQRTIAWIRGTDLSREPLVEIRDVADSGCYYGEFPLSFAVSIGSVELCTVLFNEYQDHSTSFPVPIYSSISTDMTHTPLPGAQAVERPLPA
eukprot:1223268-Rhodomonas_salina.5